jgi:hypothetical protein
MVQQLPGSIINLGINLLAALGTNLPEVLVRKDPVVITTTTMQIIITIIMALVGLVETRVVMALEATAPEGITQLLKVVWVPLEECQCHLHRLLLMVKERLMEVGIDHNLLQTVVVVEVEVVVVVVAVVAVQILLWRREVVGSLLLLLSFFLLHHGITLLPCLLLV